MAHLSLDDATLFYELHGHGTPVLLIQGVGMIGAGWTPQVDALGSFAQCLTYDNRGIGRSTDRAAKLTIEHMADDALALMDAVGWNSAHVVGHSMGGVIAQQVALAAPQRVRSLSLLCTFSSGSEAARPTPWIIWMSMRVRAGSRAMRRRAFLEMILPESYFATHDAAAVAASFAPLVGRDLSEQPAILMKQLGAMGRYNALARLHTLASIPTLVVSAEHDRIARPAFGRRLAQAIPGARYQELKGEGHAVPIYDPEKINDLLRDHISTYDHHHKQV